MKKLRMISAVMTACTVFFASVLPVSAETPDSPDIKSAKSAILTELSTGTVLFESNADEKLPIASVTKIMTLLLAAEEIEKGALSFDDIAVCSDYASSMDGSVIWLESGEEMAVGELIKSIVIASSNDSAVMLAEHIAGSEKAFVERMNKKAEELGMINTRFENCVGYDSENHYSTARDISLMAAELRNYSYFDEFLLTRLDSVRTGTERETQLVNTNRLINYYNGITGLKTGTTDNAGCCLCATAQRSDMELVAVVLGCNTTEDRFDSAENLLDYGFEGFEKITPHPSVSELVEIPVENGEKSGVDTRFSEVCPIILPKGSKNLVKYDYSHTPKISAPVTVGDTLGYVTITLDGETVGTAKIIAAETVDYMDFWKYCIYLLKAFFRF